MKRFLRNYFCTKQETQFGYQKVQQGEKQNKVNEVFHSVANNYDIMNDILSLGLHRCWKETFVHDIGMIRHSQKFNQQDQEKQNVQARILDVAGGTGDIAFKMIQQFNSQSAHPDFKVTCLDINESMLEVGKKRAVEQGVNLDQVEFVVGNAEDLSYYEDNTFDLYTISFGLRNVPKTELALSEAYRVLRPGGRFMCLEFSKVQNPQLDLVYRFYNTNFLPFVGSMVAKDSQSYQYLAESIDLFYDQQTLLQKIDQAGFKYSSYKNLAQGICAIHSGFKI